MVYKQMLSQKNKHFKSYTDDSESKQTWEYFCKLKQNTRLPQYVEHYLWTHKEHGRRQTTAAEDENRSVIDWKNPSESKES